MNSTPILFSLFGYDDLVAAMQKQLQYDVGVLTLHQFPDEETLVKIDTDVAGRKIIFVTSLDRPNNKIIPLLFAAKTARELGAKSIHLITPYLAYMRQDKQFQPGQGITSKYFSQLISQYFDGLLTIDPHLHRWHALSEIYSIPTTVIHATKTIGLWIHEHVTDPLLIGPDEESRQWVEDIAKVANAPFLILKKTRTGDRNINVSIPNIENHCTATPILIDDIISTGMTMIESVKHLHSLKMKPPICIGVHAVFAGNAYQDLLAARVEKVITCNCITHVSNGINLDSDICQDIPAFLGR